MNGYVKKYIILNYCWTCKSLYIQTHTVRTNYPCKSGTYSGLSMSSERLQKLKMRIHIHLLSWLVVTHTFQIHTNTLPVTHPHEQNTRHLNLYLFLVRCAPSLNTKPSSVVATQLRSF